MSSPKTETFFELLQPDGVKLLVTNFYENVFAEPILIPLFNQASKSEIIDKQYAFLTQFLGGPLIYSSLYGPPKMRMRHFPHQITPIARDAWLKCMRNAINTLEINEKQKEELYNCFPKLANHMVNTHDKL